VQLDGTFRKLALSAFLVGGAPALSACVSASEHGYYDDYPHPPAHPDGYWYDYPAHPGLFFDSWLGLYSIHGYPDHYFHGGYFYRWHSGHWSRSRHWGRGWEHCDARHLPRAVHSVDAGYYARGRSPRRGWKRDGREHPQRSAPHRGWRDARDGGARNLRGERAASDDHGRAGRGPADRERAAVRRHPLSDAQRGRDRALRGERGVIRTPRLDVAPPRAERQRAGAERQRAARPETARGSRQPGRASTRTGGRSGRGGQLR
jgi:hypothetical protein